MPPVNPAPSTSIVAATFEELRSRVLIKPYMVGDPYAEGWQRVMGRAWDEGLDKITQARMARWPDYCPSDGLVYLAKERGLERVLVVGTTGGQLQSESSFRGDLVSAWTIWDGAGSQDTHVERLSVMGLSATSIHRRVDWSMPPETPNDYLNAFQKNVWAQFDVLISRPHPWRVIKWGENGLVWGGPWTWGSSATPDEVAQLRRQVLRFASGHETPTWAVVNMSSGNVWGAFTWGQAGAVWGGSGEVVRWLIGESHWRDRGLV